MEGPLELEEGDLLIVSLLTLNNVVVPNVTLELAVDLTLPASVTPVTVAVRSLRAGYFANVPDTAGYQVAFLARTTATLTNATTVVVAGFNNGIVDSGIGPNDLAYPRRILVYDDASSRVTVDGPPLVLGAGNNLEVVDLVALGVTVELDGDLSGGVQGWLDAIGAERNLGRGADESDTTYRDRIRNLPDIVSYNAIYRAVSRILTPLGVSFRVMESRGRTDFIEPGWGQFAWDNPNTDIQGLEQHLFQGDRFEYQGFYVLVERPSYGDSDWPFDQHPGGVHPSAAWDFMSYDGDGSGGWWADLFRLINEVERVRAAGVPWLLVLVEAIPPIP
jgi:hypothetical protein